jgi:glutamate formiminotransferase / 5-formyltetrahydrofolate cyclo-ligase
VSEGRDPAVIDALRVAAGDLLLDLHSDPDHHRSVVTLSGGASSLVDAVCELAKVATERIDLSRHIGVHPRMGALDVVPFAPLREGPLDEACAARELALAALGELGLPCFRFGPLADGSTRSLPALRRDAFATAFPDADPLVAHRTAGAVAVGAREPLVAWNLWLSGVTLRETRRLSSAVRSDDVRALGFPVRGGTQVSCNLLEPDRVTPLNVYEQVAAALPAGGRIDRCELVGLVPDALLDAVPRDAWARLDLSESRSIEHALAARSARG